MNIFGRMKWSNEIRIHNVSSERAYFLKWSKWIIFNDWFPSINEKRNGKWGESGQVDQRGRRCSETGGNPFQGQWNGGEDQLGCDAIALVLDRRLFFVEAADDPSRDDGDIGKRLNEVEQAMDRDGHCLEGSTKEHRNQLATQQTKGHVARKSGTPCKQKWKKQMGHPTKTLVLFPNSVDIRAAEEV